MSILCCVPQQQVLHSLLRRCRSLTLPSFTHWSLEILPSPSSKYLLLSFIGQGSFGKVAKCLKMEDMKTVAIKMMRNINSCNLNAQLSDKSLKNKKKVLLTK